jgi:hypothetical protein
VDSVFEFASKVRRNVIAEVLEPKLDVSSRVFSIPGARIWVRYGVCMELQREVGVLPRQRSEFIVVHVWPRPSMVGPSVDPAGPDRPRLHAISL